MSLVRAAGCSLVVGCALLLAATSAAASPLDRAVATDRTDVPWRLAGDGRRYAAYERPDRTPVVFDARTGFIRAITGAKGCEPVDVAAGRVLLQCASADPGAAPPRIAPVGGGRARVLGTALVGESFDRIGRYWIGGDTASCGTPMCAHQIYINWRTGERSAQPGDRANLDLDRRTLLRAPPFPNVALGSAYDLVAYDRHAAVTDDGTHLALHREHRTPQPIGQSLGACCLDGKRLYGMRFGGGMVTWVNGASARAVRIGTLHARTVSLGGRHGSILPTTHGLVLARPTGTEAGKRTFTIALVHAP